MIKRKTDKTGKNNTQDFTNLVNKIRFNAVVIAFSVLSLLLFKLVVSPFVFRVLFLVPRFFRPALLSNFRLLSFFCLLNCRSLLSVLSMRSCLAWSASFKNFLSRRGFFVSLEQIAQGNKTFFAGFWQGDHWLSETFSQTLREIQPKFSQPPKLLRNTLKLFEKS